METRICNCKFPLSLDFQAWWDMDEHSHFHFIRILKFHRNPIQRFK